MTTQEAFDKICTRLARQGRRAYQGDNCQYLTDDGLRCAVGVLLPKKACVRLSGDVYHLDVRLLINKHIPLSDQSDGGG